MTHKEFLIEISVAFDRHSYDWRRVLDIAEELPDDAGEGYDNDEDGDPEPLPGDRSPFRTL